MMTATAVKLNLGFFSLCTCMIVLYLVFDQMIFKKNWAQHLHPLGLFHRLDASFAIVAMVE